MATFAVFKVHGAGHRSTAIGRFTPEEVSKASLAGSMMQLWTIRPEEEETREVTRNASVDDRIACLAARQHGVVTRSQLLAEGLTRRMVGSRVRSERLRPLHRGVYILGSLRASLEPERGLPVPETNVVVRGHELDFLWRAVGIAVEVDGFGFHASRRSFENDRRRDAELAAAGVYVIRVTWRQIVDEPSATLVHVAQALARSTPPRAGTGPL